MAKSGSEPTGLRNAILLGLPPDDLAALRPYLHEVPLVMRQVLHAAGAPIHDIYFLDHGVTSLTAGSGDGDEVEVGLTGSEGLVGTAALLMPQPMAAHRAFMQVPGSAHRIQIADFRVALTRSDALRESCLRYVQFMLVQAAQCVACNARHGLPERLARWLLSSMDRIGSDELPMTQEFLSFLLGVRRAGVSVVANALQDEGFIRQSRGRVTLIDREGLTAKACNCYAIIKENQRSIMN